MKAGNCPSPAELSRAFLDGAEPSLLSHLEQCPACTTEWGALAELRALGKQLPHYIPDVAHLDGMRAQLLAKLEAPTATKIKMVPARWLWASGAVAAACLVLLLKLWGGSHAQESAPAQFRATVQTQGADVHFSHERHGGDEWVRLSRGKLLIEVAPLAKGERFRVLCHAGEVEVRGTAFETEVLDDRLLSVHVLHGRVEVRPSAGRILLLGAGESWQASPVPVPAPPAVASEDKKAPSRPAALEEKVGPPAHEPTLLAPAGALSAAPKSAPPSHPVVPSASKPAVPTTPQREAAETPHAAVSTPKTEGAPTPSASPGERTPVVRAHPVSAAERAFDEGWVALRRADFAAAAEAFARIESAQSNEPLVEDARFWRAVALGRAGQTQAEAVALERFLALHPGSPRAGEASAILGWLLIKQGRIAEAEQRFTTAAHDLREEVKHSAQAGLSQIQKQRAVQPAPATQ